MSCLRWNLGRDQADVHGLRDCDRGPFRHLQILPAQFGAEELCRSVHKEQGGNIKEVEKDLGISYPTVRNRLDAVIAALGGYAVDDSEDDVATRRKRLLSLWPRAR